MKLNIKVGYPFQNLNFMKPQTRLPYRMVKAMQYLNTDTEIINNYEKQIRMSTQCNENYSTKLTIQTLYVKALKNTPKKAYFNIQKQISEQNRSDIIQWYQNTAKSKRLHQEVVIRAIQLFDLYLSKVPNALDLQVYNISKYPPIYTFAGMCLSIAQKMVQQVPNVFRMFLPTFQTTKFILLNAEVEILKVFKYNVNLLTYVDVINFLVDQLFNQHFHPVQIEENKTMEYKIQTGSDHKMQSQKKFTPNNSSLMNNSNITLNNSFIIYKNDKNEKHKVQSKKQQQQQDNDEHSLQQRQKHRNSYTTLEDFKEKTITQAYEAIQKQANYITTNYFDVGVIALMISLQQYGRDDKIQQLRYLITKQLQDYDFKTCGDIANTILYNMSNDNLNEWQMESKYYLFITNDNTLV